MTSDPNTTMPAAIPSSTAFGNGSGVGDGWIKASADLVRARRSSGSVQPRSRTESATPRSAANVRSRSPSGPVPATEYRKGWPVAADARASARIATSCPFSQFRTPISSGGPRRRNSTAEQRPHEQSARPGSLGPLGPRFHPLPTNRLHGCGDVQRHHKPHQIALKTEVISQTPSHIQRDTFDP
jgi:hypothetical protein